MAKKKEKKTSSKWMYKNRVKSHKSKIHNEWLKCDAATKERIEKSYPNHFIYEPIKAPEPTPSMVSKTD